MPRDQFKAYVERQLQRRFKAIVAYQGKDISQVISELIEEWVKQNEPQMLEELQPKQERSKDNQP
ncbi:plasmid partition protein ParG [Tolypothrix sp. VBCCA 56010]|uniref:plasmid partition protein ParG n=1 Tax=Tolypothrix sp. VBCCA 56010 TaxID=3137731 RepID=UPI003D7C5635